MSKQWAKSHTNQSDKTIGFICMDDGTHSYVFYYDQSNGVCHTNWHELWEGASTWGGM